VVEASEKIYSELCDMGLDVLIDDRDERAGVKFNDADLLGIPVRITIGMRGVKEGIVELKMRFEKEIESIPIKEASSTIAGIVRDLYDSIK